MKKITLIKKVRSCRDCDHLAGPSFFGNGIAGGYVAYCRKKFNKKIFETRWETPPEYKKVRRSDAAVKIPEWCPLEDF